MKRLILAIFISILILNVQATVRNVPSSYPTIQAALSVCIAADTVMVAPGTYFENISWPSVGAIKLLSSGDASNTIINGNGSARVISMSSALIDTNTVIRGFRIMNGANTSFPTGAGVYLSNSSPLIEFCIISDNVGNGSRSYGAGVSLNNSSAVFRNCIFERNLGKPTGSYNYGGAIYSSGNSLLTLSHCIIRDNLLDTCSRTYGCGIYLNGGSAKLSDVMIQDNKTIATSWNYGTGIFLSTGTSAMLDRVFITNNIQQDGGTWYTGGGIYGEGCTLTVTNSLIADNILGNGGNYYYGAGIQLASSSVGNFMNTTIANNRRANGSNASGGSFYLVTSSQITVTNSILWNIASTSEIYNSASTSSIGYSVVNGGHAGVGNLNSAPLFNSPSDYSLQPVSPCVNAGTLNGAPLVDISGSPRPMPAMTNPDIGAYEINQITTGLSVHSPFSSKLRVYPNPFTQNFEVEFNLTNDGDVSLELFEITGRLSMKYQREKTTSGILKLSMNTEELPSGVYILKFSSESAIYTEKLIKQ
jgi:hypothetical protein